MKLFQFAIIFREVDKDNKPTGKGKIIQEPKSVLAADEKAVLLQAAKLIPEEYSDKLEQIDIAIRPF